MYKSAIKLSKFSEVNGINPGFSESGHGAGFGEKLRKQVISDAFDIVKKGVQFPEISQLVSLFEDASRLGTDTAEIRGTPKNLYQNKDWVGEILKDCRKQVIIATKRPFVMERV